MKLYRGVVLGSLVLASLGCGKSNTKVETIQESQGSSASKWTLKLQSNCGTMPAEACVGGYGFSLNADGVYLLGPGPQGEKLTGKVTTQELNVLDALITKEFDTAKTLDTKEVCDEGEELPGKNQITLQLWKKDADIMKIAGKTFCYRAKSADVAHRLRDELVQLAGKYYGIPFPKQNCEQGVATLDTTYSSLKSCKVDTDCTYLGKDFEPISGEGFIGINDCETVKPPVIGNKKQVEIYGAALLALVNSTVETCKNQPVLTTCNGFEWYATETALTCQRGVCQEVQSTPALRMH